MAKHDEFSGKRRVGVRWNTMIWDKGIRSHLIRKIKIDSMVVFVAYENINLDFQQICSIPRNGTLYNSYNNVSITRLWYKMMKKCRENHPLQIMAAVWLKPHETCKTSTDFERSAPFSTVVGDPWSNSFPKPCTLICNMSREHFLVN